jgi:hypothetical protein
MKNNNTIKERLQFCLFGTTAQRKISLDIIDKVLLEYGFDTSKPAYPDKKTTDEKSEE